MIIGYARPIPRKLSLKKQIRLLKHCDKLYQDVESQQTELDKCIQEMSAGDILIVVNLDLISSSKHQLWKVLHKLERKSIRLQILNPHTLVNQRTQVLLQVCGLLNSPESKVGYDRELTSENKAIGKGRILEDSQVLEIRQKRKEGIRIKDLMGHYGISRSTAHRYLRKKSKE